MDKGQQNDLNALGQRVIASLQKAEKITSDLRKTNTRLLVAGIASSAVTTLIAGITAAQGPLIGSGIEGWRLACILAAIFAFVSTLSTGMNQQLKITDRLSKSMQCVGKLKSLDVMLSTKSRNWEQIVAEYEDIARNYPEFIT